MRRSGGCLRSELTDGLPSFSLSPVAGIKPSRRVVMACSLANASDRLMIINFLSNGKVKLCATLLWLNKIATA